MDERDADVPNLRQIARELATLRKQLIEVRLQGGGDRDEIAHLRDDIERLSVDLRRIGAMRKVPPPPTA
jgi:hypothetical protein